VVRVRGAREQVAESLKRVPGVTAVIVKESPPGRSVDDVELQVLFEPPDKNLNPELVRALTAGGHEVLEVRRVGVTLEEVFLKAVAGESPSNPTGAFAAIEPMQKPEVSANVA